MLTRDDYIQKLFDLAIGGGSYTLHCRDEKSAYSVRAQMNRWRKKLREENNLPPEYDDIILGLNGQKILLSVSDHEFKELFERNKLPLPEGANLPDEDDLISLLRGERADDK